MITVFRNARPLSGGKILPPCDVAVDDGKFVSVGKSTVGDEYVECGGTILCAGFIDVHTHGGWGKDCMEATREAIGTMARYHLSTGVTTFVPTTMTASTEDIDAAVDNIAAYNSPYARIFGVHLEGPYLSANAAGAHPKHLLRAPLKENQSFVWRNLKSVTRITLAPNLVGAAEFCRDATAVGIQISLGHDNSIDDEIYACIDAGATSVTHMYNCTSRPSRRDNPKKHLGLTEVGLCDDRLACEVIADDRHVPNALFKMIYKLKGARGICFVSDSLSVAGMPAGDYYLGSGESKQSIRIEDGVAVLPAENTYAGSVTPISKMAANAYALGIPAEDALAMATLSPANLIGARDRGDVTEGLLADFNLLADDLSVRATYLNGKAVPDSLKIL